MIKKYTLNFLLVTDVLTSRLKCMVTSWRYKVDRTTLGPRMLTTEEKKELRHDMAASSAWAKAELKRRRDAKNQKNSSHGIVGGIEKDTDCN